MRFCPHCGGDIGKFIEVTQTSPTHAGLTSPTPASPVPPARKPYDQTKVWRDLVLRAKSIAGGPPPLTDLVDPAIARLLELGRGATEPIDTIVHIVFDKPIVPHGGVLLQSVRSDGQAPATLAHMKALGYLIVNDKVVDHDGIPVSPAFGAVNYWGGEKQFKRWHLARPVMLSASRNDNPYFMDEEMMAFGAVWADTLKARDALVDLLSTMIEGVGGADPIATPLVLEITPRA